MNLHLYPSPITNESRIVREVTSLEDMRIFDRIVIAGVWEPGLAHAEGGPGGSEIHRLARNTSRTGLRAKIDKAVHFSFAVVRRYRVEPLVCINCHSVAALPAAVVLKRLTGARLVYDTHELETETQGLRGPRKWLYQLVERALIGQVDHTLVVTTSIEHWYRDRYGLQSVSTLPNYPRSEPALDQGLPRRFHEEFGLDSSVTVFLYQGVLARGRGVREVADAVAGLDRDDVALVLMGWGELRGYLDELAAHYHRIFVHDAVAPAELPAWTRSGDVGVSLIGGEDLCLSYQLSGPNKLYQYLHADLPVLASPIVEQARVLERHRVGILLRNLSQDEIAAAVGNLADVGRAPYAGALEQARQEYTWESLVGVFKEVYLERLGFTECR